jgi:hypothetical protein
MDGNLTLLSAQAKEIEHLKAEVEKYKALEAECKQAFKEISEILGIDFSKPIDAGDIIGSISGLLRQIAFSKKKQKEFGERFAKFKTIIQYFTNGTAGK